MSGEPALNDLELAPNEVVRQAVIDFAATLAETAQFKAHEQAAVRLRDDAAACRTGCC
jgi:hypothetical protein